ncbi:MAG: hypothetical protein IPM42_12755 [Saprospiraceae bacterium]|nr:hypothetical protein [Saprospiraceae bacterium]
MGCNSCAVDSNGTPRGCGDKGHCSSGSCNKLNTYDWIATRDLYDPSEYHIVEVSFKKGAHKDFFINDPMTRTVTGDMVVVETASGYDIGRISLSGELVRLQMKKKYTQEDRVTCKIIRKANERDLEKLEEARYLEKESMVKARVISRTMGLDMKIGDVEFQGDKKKATFYYTAEGRVDFRELVKEYAREFKVKIEMRQIGARQESARIGGIGSCGRELCCSTWLSDFKSVNTSAARYQNIAINQSKLSGQCGRLKCCLNYELDTYMDALEDFPENADVLKSKTGTANLMKVDIFKGVLYYSFSSERQRGTILALDKERVKEILIMNKKGTLPDEFANTNTSLANAISADDANYEHDYEDVTGLIELRNDPKKRKKKKGPNQGNAPSQNRPQGGDNNRGPQQNPNKPQGAKPNQPNQQNRPHGQNPKGPAQPQGPRPPKPENKGPESDPNTTPPQNTTGEGGNIQPNKKKKKFFNKNRKPKNE